MIQRIFHPIGQGAFYSERHNGFNMVYDFGNRYNTNKFKKLVSQSFKKNETIDVLFISHFDSDHINRIEILKEKFKIRNVIMPLLNEVERLILSSFFRATNQLEALCIVSDADSFFHGETSVVRVLPSDSPDQIITDEEEDVNTIRGNVKSGIKLFLKDWVFMPYNYEYKNRHKILKELFNIEKLDIERFKKDLNYALANRKKVKEIYDKLEGKINQNSMMLYSGPRRQCIPTRFMKSIQRSAIFDTRSACIYTGDGDLNKTKINKVFSNYWERVGTIQIPHHGDINSFNNEILGKRNFHCPISVGIKNSYGHPSSKVIADIQSFDSIPILVTEDVKDLYVETIYEFDKKQ